MTSITLKLEMSFINLENSNSNCILGALVHTIEWKITSLYFCQCTYWRTIHRKIPKVLYDSQKKPAKRGTYFLTFIFTFLFEKPKASRIWQKPILYTRPPNKILGGWNSLVDYSLFVVALEPILDSGSWCFLERRFFKFGKIILA